MLIRFESEGVVNCVSAVKVWGLIWVNALCALVKMLYCGLNWNFINSHGASQFFCQFLWTEVRWKHEQLIFLLARTLKAFLYADIHRIYNCQKTNTPCTLANNYTQLLHLKGHLHSVWHSNSKSVWQNGNINTYSKTRQEKRQACLIKEDDEKGADSISEATCNSLANQSNNKPRRFSFNKQRGHKLIAPTLRSRGLEATIGNDSLQEPTYDILKCIKAKSQNVRHREGVSSWQAGKWENKKKRRDHTVVKRGGGGDAVYFKVGFNAAESRIKLQTCQGKGVSMEIHKNKGGKKKRKVKEN